MTDDGSVAAVDPDSRLFRHGRVRQQDERIPGLQSVHALGTIPEDGAMNRGVEVLGVVGW